MKVTAPGPNGTTITIDDQRLAPLAARAAHTTPSRLAFAALHVVMRSSYAGVAHTLERPGSADEIAAHLDVEATMGLRRHVDALGLGVAEAMDTAQRFFLGWRGAERLIRACGALGLRHGFVAGAGADHLPAVRSRAELVDGVVHQARLIQECGGMPMLLPSPWLAQQATSEQGYVDVYAGIVQQLEGPLLVHWLGEMFAPALRGYFPGDSFARVMALDPGKVRGCKLSLLDAPLERRVRKECLERQQIVLTGDDFHFARLILGGDGDDEVAPPVLGFTDIGGRRVALGDFSHALLGILDATAAPAAMALRLLAAGDDSGYLQVMAPCERLGLCVFEPPTQHYKAGLAFVAWLNGLQDTFALVNHEQRARGREHYLRVAALAAAAGALTDAAVAAERLHRFAAEPWP